MNCITDISEVCREYNFTEMDRATSVRCINDEGKILVTYSKTRTTRIYIDTIDDLRENNDIKELVGETFLNMMIVEKRTNRGMTYYMSTIIIDNLAYKSLSLKMLTFLANNTHLLKNFTVSNRRTLSTRTQMIVENIMNIELRRKLKFGVEMEIVLEEMKILELRNNLRERGIEISEPNLTHDVCTGWKIVGDGSISSRNGNGYEIVSPPSSNLDELKIVCEELDKIGATVNRTCGLHVHHDIKELKRKQILRIYNFYNKYNNIIERFVKDSRIENKYCKPVKNIIDTVNSCETKQELLNKIAGRRGISYYSNCRYYSLNLRSYLFYGTIEFRQHHGTIDFDEISSWILFTHKIVERALEEGNDIIYNLDNESSSKMIFDEMMKELKCEDTTLERALLAKAIKLRKRVA